MPTHRFRALALSGALLGFPLAGCNSSPSETLVPASGSATLDGQPFAGATVGFVPETGDRPADRGSIAGELDVQGKFEMKTGAAAGAPAGKYKVVLAESLNPPAGADPAKPPKLTPVPPIYSDPSKTPLRVEVPPGGTTTLKLELRAK